MEYVGLIAFPTIIVFGTIGFTFSGIVVKNERFKHLFKVMVAVWVPSLVYVLSPIGEVKETIAYWILALSFWFIIMLVGGVLSLVFRWPD